MNNAVSRTATLLAVALLGVIALAVFKGALDERLVKVRTAPAAEQSVLKGSAQLVAAKAPTDICAATRRTLDYATDESFVTSFRVLMLIAAGLALASAICAGIMIEPRRNA